MNNNQLLPYIHLVIDQLMSLEGADYDNDRAASPEDKSKGLIARNFGIEKWGWPQGVGLYGLLKLQGLYEDGQYSEFLKNWYDSNLKRGLPSCSINTITPYLTLTCLLDIPDNPEHEELCIRQVWWLITEMPHTPEGGFQHVASATGDRNGVILNDGELWVDALSMAALFLSKVSQRCGEREQVSESIHQVLFHIRYLYEKKNGLFCHGFSFPLNSNLGDIFWYRGNSWFIVGITDYLEIFRGSLDVGFSTYLVDTYKVQMQALKELQSPPGSWYTTLTDPASYEEVFGSATIATGILRGPKLGVLDEVYRPYVQSVMGAIRRNIGEDGTVENASANIGTGYDAQHYKDIVIMPMTYGQSLALLTPCEASAWLFFILFLYLSGVLPVCLLETHPK